MTWDDRAHLAINRMVAPGLIGLVCLAGCAGPSPTLAPGGVAVTSPRPIATDDTPVKAVDASETDDEGGQLASRSPDELARLAQRDVEAMLTARNAPAAPTETRHQRQGSSRPAIQWNDATDETDVNPAPVEPSPPASAAGADDVVSGPLYRPEEVVSVAPVETMLPDADLTPGERDRIQELMVELSRELYRESAYADVPMRELLVIAAQSIVRPDRTLSSRAIPGLTDREREVLEAVQQFYRTVGEELGAGRDASDVVAEQVTALRNKLVEAPRLTISDKSLCHHVAGFGRYEKFNRSAFLAHADQKVILYLGVEDFSSELNEKGQWVTELAQQIIIYSDRDGIPVWTADWQPVVDVSQNQRHDFFTVQVITIPNALGVGRYHLKARLRDEKSGAETETGIPFEMVADEKLAAGAAARGR